MWVVGCLLGCGGVVVVVGVGCGGEREWEMGWMQADFVGGFCGWERGRERGGGFQRVSGRWVRSGGSGGMGWVSERR